MRIKIGIDLNRVDVFLDNLKTKALVQATRGAMNRSLSMLVTRAGRIARDNRKLKLKEIKNDFFKIKRAKGNSLGELDASLEISGRPMSLIRFVVGDKSPRPQAGIPVAKRKRVKVEVKPGTRAIRAHAFIAQGKGGNFQVFTRKGQGRFNKQSVPSLASVFAKDEIHVPLEKFAQEQFLSEFDRLFTYKLEQLSMPKKGL